MALHIHDNDPKQAAYNRVLTHLKRKHIRITETRKAVIVYMINAHHHPSAEQIYRDLLPQYPSMSLATVYNNLKVLIDEGFVAELKLSNDNTAYFDFMGDDHLHVVCESCGKITDFADADLSSIEEEAHEQTGYDITRTQLLMYGLCPDCQKRERIR